MRKLIVLLVIAAPPLLAVSESANAIAFSRQYHKVAVDCSDAKCLTQPKLIRL